MRIYHNPRCSKSRKTLALIRERGIEPEVIEYLKEPPSQAELETIIQYLDCTANDLVRKKESLYGELGIASLGLGDKELVAVLIEHPRLIERPIVVGNGRAIIGRPPEKVAELF